MKQGGFFSLLIHTSPRAIPTLSVNEHFIESRSSRLPVQDVGQFLLEYVKVLLASCLSWHLGTFPDQENLDRGKPFVTFHHIAGNCAREGVAVSFLNGLQFLDQFCLLTYPHRYANVGDN